MCIWVDLWGAARIQNHEWCVDHTALSIQHWVLFLQLLVLWSLFAQGAGGGGGGMVGSGVPQVGTASA